MLAEPNLAQGEFTLWTASQIPHFIRTFLTIELGIPEAKMRVIAPDVGGGFGSKLEHYGEEAVAVAVARELGRPVKWTEERSEGYLATIHGRDMYQHIELAATREGVLKAVRVKLEASMGAYLRVVSPAIPMLGAWLYAGVYDPEAYDFAYDMVFTNTTPTDAYRGAGRPEATYAIEMTMDKLARRAGDGPGGAAPQEHDHHGQVPQLHHRERPHRRLRRLHRAPSTSCLETLDYEGIRREQAERRQRGDTQGDRRRLLDLARDVRPGALAGPRRPAVRGRRLGGEHDRDDADRHRQAVDRHLAPRPGARDDLLPDGRRPARRGVRGRGGASTATPNWCRWAWTRTAAAAWRWAASPPTTRARRSSPRHGRWPPTSSSAPRTTSSGRRGNFTVAGTDRSVDIKTLAFAAWSAHDLPEGFEPGLTATHIYDPPNFSWPHGAHACVVEVDTETGSVDLQRYVAVDDCGVQINPKVVEGQVHGGVAQGIAEALFEEARYDEEGNLLHGTMTTYMIPAATELPSFELDSTVTPSPTNPLGVKGIGEAGTIAAPPAVVGAIVDALSHLGVTDIERPATPERVWKAIQEARS